MEGDNLVLQAGSCRQAVWLLFPAEVRRWLGSKGIYSHAPQTFCLTVFRAQLGDQAHKENDILGWGVLGATQGRAVLEPKKQ